MGVDSLHFGSLCFCSLKSLPSSLHILFLGWEANWVSPLLSIHAPTPHTETEGQGQVGTEALYCGREGVGEEGDFKLIT